MSVLPSVRGNVAWQAGWAHRVGKDLQETASDLARIAARPGRSCTAGFGVCPEHGNALTSTGGTIRSTAAGCGRSWGYDRVGMPCAEHATHRVTDAGGGRALVCDGHAVDARARLDGGRIEPL
ncbi:hypothetical protein [Nonomuraea sp. NPDC003754]